MRPAPRPDAPFRSYKVSDSGAYQDGVESARAWRPHWNWRPAGPWYPSLSERERQFEHPDWIEYCDTRVRHNRLWRQGWEDEMVRLDRMSWITKH